MEKLIPKHGLGNIIDTIDSKLNSLGEWGKLGVQMIDPTGISGWKDVKETSKALAKEKSMSNIASFAMAALGAIPMVGGLGKLIGKGSNAIKTIDKIQDTAKASDKIFRTSGSVKVFGKDLTSKLKTSANSTKDKRLIKLSEIATESRDKHIAYPEEFVNYVDSLLKTPNKKQVDTKLKIAVSSDGKTPQMTGTTEFLFGETSEGVKVIEVPKNAKKSRKQVHTGEFREKKNFKREAISKTTIEDKSEGIDIALKAFQDIQNGDFTPSEKMVLDIYSKSFGKVSSFLDEAANTHAVRHEFNFTEYPKILMHQITSPLEQIPSDTYEQMSYQNIQRVKRMFENLEKKQKGHTVVPIIREPKGKPYTLFEYNISSDFDFNHPSFQKKVQQIYDAGYKQGRTKEQIDEAVNNYINSLKSRVDSNLSGQSMSANIPSPPINITTGKSAPYVIQYGFKNPITGEVTPITKLEEHHARSLATQMAQAYLKNPKPIDPKEMLSLYQGQREVDFLNQFYLLTKQQHTASPYAIHYNDEFTLQDLGRIKNLARITNFENLNDLLDYYRTIVKKKKFIFRQKRRIYKIF